MVVLQECNIGYTTSIYQEEKTHLVKILEFCLSLSLSSGRRLMYNKIEPPRGEKGATREKKEKKNK